MATILINENMRAGYFSPPLIPLRFHILIFIFLEYSIHPQQIPIYFQAFYKLLQLLLSKIYKFQKKVEGISLNKCLFLL